VRGPPNEPRSRDRLAAPLEEVDQGALLKVLVSLASALDTVLRGN